MERKNRVCTAVYCMALGLLLVIPQGVTAQAATALSCGKWINTESGNTGTVAWLNLPGAQCDADEARAYTANASGTQHTQALLFNNFGFNLPADAQVLGIELTLVRRSANGVSVSDRTVQLLKNGIPTGSNQRVPGTWDRDWAGVSYGGPHDTWGSKWTPSELNSTAFGLTFDADIVGQEDRAEVDQVLVMVYYQPSGVAIRNTPTASKYVCAPFHPRP